MFKLLRWENRVRTNQRERQVRTGQKGETDENWSKGRARSELVGATD